MYKQKYILVVTYIYNATNNFSHMYIYIAVTQVTAMYRQKHILVVFYITQVTTMHTGACTNRNTYVRARSIL